MSTIYFNKPVEKRVKIRKCAKNFSSGLNRIFILKIKIGVWKKIAQIMKFRKKRKNVTILHLFWDRIIEFKLGLWTTPTTGSNSNHWFKDLWEFQQMIQDLILFLSVKWRLRRPPPKFISVPSPSHLPQALYKSPT